MNRMPPCHYLHNNTSNFVVDSYKTSFNMDRTLYPLTSALNQHSSNSGYQPESANVNVESIQETTELWATNTFCPSDLRTYLRNKWAITLPSGLTRFHPFPFWTSPLSSSLIHCSLSPSTKLLLLPLETQSGALAKRFWSLLRCSQRSQSKNGWTVRGLYIGIVIHLYTPSPPSLVLVLWTVLLVVYPRASPGIHHAL